MWASLFGHAAVPTNRPKHSLSTFHTQQQQQKQQQQQQQKQKQKQKQHTEKASFTAPNQLVEL
jgi:hypothetical protein